MYLIKMLYPTVENITNLYITKSLIDRFNERFSLRSSSKIYEKEPQYNETSL